MKIDKKNKFFISEYNSLSYFYYINHLFVIILFKTSILFLTNFVLFPSSKKFIPST